MRKEPMTFGDIETIEPNTLKPTDHIAALVYITPCENMNNEHQDHTVTMITKGLPSFTVNTKEQLLPSLQLIKGADHTYDDENKVNLFSVLLAKVSNGDYNKYRKTYAKRAVRKGIVSGGVNSKGKPGISVCMFLKSKHYTVDGNDIAIRSDAFDLLVNMPDPDLPFPTNQRK